MEEGRSNFHLGINMLVNIVKVNLMGMALIVGKMVMFMRDIFKMGREVEKEI